MWFECRVFVLGEGGDKQTNSTKYKAQKRPKHMVPDRDDISNQWRTTQYQIRTS